MRRVVVVLARMPVTLVPSLLTWSRLAGGSLAVVQDAPEGCKVLLAAPTVMLRERNLAKNGAERAEAPRRRARRTDRPRARAAWATRTPQRRGSAWTPRLSSTTRPVTVSPSEKRIAAPASNRARRTQTNARRNKRLASLNELTLPVANPVFLAFAPCGTRLAVMSVQRRGREIALHELDCAVALFALYGNADAAVRDDRAHFSDEARETVRLLKASRELSFCHGPRTLPSRCWRCWTARASPGWRPSARAAPEEEEEDETTTPRFATIACTTSVGTRRSSRGRRARWLFPPRRREGEKTKTTKKQKQKQTRAAPRRSPTRFSRPNSRATSGK